jgi:hypothetical protein
MSQLHFELPALLRSANHAKYMPSTKNVHLLHSDKCVVTANASTGDVWVGLDESVRDLKLACAVLKRYNELIGMQEDKILAKIKAVANSKATWNGSTFVFALSSAKGARLRLLVEISEREQALRFGKTWHCNDALFCAVAALCASLPTLKIEKEQRIL